MGVATPKHNAIFKIYYEDELWRVKYPISYRDVGTRYDRIKFEKLEDALKWMERHSHHIQSIIDYADKCCGGSLDLAQQDLFGETEEDEDETGTDD